MGLQVQKGHEVDHMLLQLQVQVILVMRHENVIYNSESLDLRCQGKVYSILEWVELYKMVTIEFVHLCIHKEEHTPCIFVNSLRNHLNPTDHLTDEWEQKRL